MPQKNLDSISVSMRRIILDQAFAAHTGHIGCALSVVNILSTLYFSVLKMKSATDPNRDRFILSKGHAVMALHAALYLRGWINDKTLHSFYKNGTYLGVHPEVGLTGVELATGSLGQGLAVGAGVALAARMKKKTFKTYVLISDGECNEGSIWESAAFAAHNKLNNLVAIVDKNGQQGFGYTKDIMSLDPLHEKWRAFGWNVKEIDDNVAEIKKALIVKKSEKRPTILIVRTTLGRDVSFMQRKIDWHYMPLTKQQHATAIADIHKGKQR